MAEKDKSKEGLITSYLSGKRQERCSSSSSPESKTPPAKSVKIMPSTSDSTEMAEMREMLTQIQDNTNKLLEDNQTLRMQYADLHESLNFHIAKVEKLETENQTLKKEVRFLKTSLEEVKEDNDAMAEDLATAINKIDDLEQYSRKHNLEFHGIPESSQENLAEQIIKLGNVLNVPIRNNDIDICHRLPASKKSNNKPRPIIRGTQREKIGKRLKMQFSAFSYPFIAF